MRTRVAYQGKNEGELSFQAHSQATVLERNESGWWWVRIGAQEGWYVSFDQRVTACLTFILQGIGRSAGAK